jgi:hypothetical protein
MPDATPPTENPAPNQPAPEANGQKPEANTPPVETDKGNAPDLVGGKDFSELDPKTQAYIKNLREENRKFREAKEAAEREQARAERERLKQQGEWQKLAETAQAEVEQYKPYKERYEQLEAVFKTALEARIEAIPAQFRKLVPTDYSPVQQWKWLDQNASLFKAKDAPNINPGTPAGDANQVNQTPAYLEDIKRRFRL